MFVCVCYDILNQLIRCALFCVDSRFVATESQMLPH